jgi:hypothetical protein
MATYRSQLLMMWFAVATSVANLTATEVADTNWWSLKPLVRPQTPELDDNETARARTVIDAFVIAQHGERGLTFSPTADRRTLIRRVHYDILGLPPSPERVDAFLRDDDPLAYEKLVDELLASPHYGERWARHWLDVVHYGDTHGYDKDKLRPNAWPYRDYVVRAFNVDTRYDRFVREQLAGDVYYPDTVDGITALGFISAGPWDYIGHAEVPETKIDGRIARHLDRDDMVSSTMTTFLSTTASCARCHHHKFDPVTMEDYYSLQAVFAAVDRADRTYDSDPQLGRRRRELTRKLRALQAESTEADALVRQRAGGALAELEKGVKEIEESQQQSDAYGYHSGIERQPNVTKWVQVDLGSRVKLAAITLIGAYDEFGGIGAGFGFPPRFRIEISDDDRFESGVETIVDYAGRDFDNPGCTPQRFDADGEARYVRVTATKLVRRDVNDFTFALGELQVFARESGENAAHGARVTAMDSIEQPVRWKKINLVDGVRYGLSVLDAERLARLRDELQALRDRSTDLETRDRLRRVKERRASVDAEIAALPTPGLVYAGTVYHGNGAFRGTGPDDGRPREIRVLNRGNIRTPGDRVTPGTIGILPGSPARFELDPNHVESDRRRALAEWIVAPANPLTWRSIVNRVWQYHFGRGLVETSNDFGRMGAKPSHPELLDWLAVEFRDGGQSIKRLHRLILTSTVYRQSSATNDAFVRIDGSNKYLWRMLRRRLSAEELRDTVLAVSGSLDTRMGGPGFRCFVLEQPDNSPHYEYDKHDPDARDTHCRSIYRFIVRSQQDPFMTTLDCADPSQTVDRRGETLTALQALALFNNKFMVRMSGHFATRLERRTDELDEQLELVYRLALQRDPTPEERRDVASHARRLGLVNICRVIFNLSEFVFVD